MTRDPLNVWLLPTNEDAVSELVYHVDKYGVSSVMFLTAILEYILNGESDLLDWLCDEHYTNSETQNELMFAIDVIQHSCKRQLEQIVHHYELAPSTFTVMSAVVVMGPAIKVNIQDWSIRG